MKYTFRCLECKKIVILKMSVADYSKKGFFGHFHPVGEDGYNAPMKRVYTLPQLKFVGDGFTGAQNTIPHMDKDKRKKDLSEDSGIEI